MSDPPPEDFDATRPPFAWMSQVLTGCYIVAAVSLVAGVGVSLGQPPNSPRWAFSAAIVGQCGVCSLTAGACMIAWRSRLAEVDRWRRRRYLARYPHSVWRRYRKPYDTEPWQYVVGGVCCLFLAAVWAGIATLLTRWLW